jgi:hypothetical protein
MTQESRAEAEADALADDAAVIQLSRHEPELFTYDQARADARPWLYGIATNLIGHHRRAEIRLYRALARTGVDPVTEAFTDQVDDRVSAGTASQRLAAGLGRLPEELRDTLLLVTWGDLTYAEAALEAEMYQALAALPGIQVDSHVTVIDGQAGVAFVLPPTSQSIELEIILNPSTYAFMARAAGFDGRWSIEEAAVRTVIVGAPGSTRPRLTPPTAAERLAELADNAYSSFSRQTQPLTNYLQDIGHGTWMPRQLATSSGYFNRGIAPPSSFLALADIPGVTVARVTDVTGRADVAFRFPFTDGVTEIL